MIPRIMLYESTLNELEVPARDRPSPIAFFDGKGYGRLDDSLNLEDGKKQTNKKLNGHDTD